MVVAGIGVSLATCDNDPCASWKGLLQHGLKRCEEICGTPSALLKPYREILTNPAAPSHSLINVGQFITDELNGKRPGCFGGWLFDSIGGIKTTDTTLVCALASLGVKLATTNYDNMIEEVTGRSPITWRDDVRATLFFRESTNDILHLHGYYLQPDSIILGARSYRDICSNESAQNALRSLMFMGTLVFVGCGTGLEDPNFGTLLEWARESLANRHHTHFILVRRGEVEDWRRRLEGMPIEFVTYGSDHGNLAPFLQSLAERVHKIRVREPLSILSASQTDFDACWEELGSGREGMSTLEYLQRSRMLAAKLWQAGGRHRAALAFSSRLDSHGESLLVSEYVEFALDATEWLLDDNLAFQATKHLTEIGKRTRETGIASPHQMRFRFLRVQCMDAMCAYSESLQAIEEALPHAGDEERARLEVERCEMHFLQGNFSQAVADSE